MVSTTVDEETGEEKKRLINRMRWKGYGPAAIAFHDSTVSLINLLFLLNPDREIDWYQVPEKPPQNVEDARNQVDGEIVKKVAVVSPGGVFVIGYSADITFSL